MKARAKLIFDGSEHELDLVEGSRGERAIDISSLRTRTGLVALDPGYRSTAACRSAITFVDGDRGILCYRGIPIEELAEVASFEEVCHLLLHGSLPSPARTIELRMQLAQHAPLAPAVLRVVDAYPKTASPMTVFSGAIGLLSAFTRSERTEGLRLIAKAGCIAARILHGSSRSAADLLPNGEVSWTTNLLLMLTKVDRSAQAAADEALRLAMIVHADHEQNCSTSTMRMVGSSGADLFTSAAAAICALSGPRHGGANQAVIEMLETIAADGDCRPFLAKVKARESGVRLMGFGHRVYKTYDPRAKLLKRAAHRLLERTEIKDPMLDIAIELEAIALADEYFIERHLYPNVDFYSGIIYRALGIPTPMFPVMFALGRLPGWIAHFLEMHADEDAIHRPRQIYVGPTERSLD